MRRAQGTAPVPNRIVHRIAEKAVAHPQTVRKAVEGKPVRGAVGARVEEELKRRGLR